jgi:uncharacterized protein (TIGR03083 family)
MDPFIPRLQSAVDRFSSALRTGPLDAPVVGCPGWDLAELTRHLGFIHRWARLAAVTGAPPDAARIDAAPDSSDTDAFADWFDHGARALVSALDALDPDGPTWHPFPVAKVGRVWPRRQAHEAFIHAWDAESAIGTRVSVEPWMAADGIAEYFEVIVPRVASRDRRAAPVGSLAVVCTDAEFHHGSNTLVVRADDPLTVVIDSDATPDARLVGPAADLLLALWGRRELPAEPTGTGRDDLALAWLRYGGN